MKKIICLLLALVLVLSMAACSAAEQTDTTEAEDSSVTTEAEPTETADSEEDTGETEEDEASEAVQLQFVLGTPLTNEVEYYTDDSSVVLLSEKYELPQLTLCTADGAACDLEAEAEGENAGMVEICNVFNARMQETAEELDAAAAEDLETARAQYEGLSEDDRANWANYAEELTLASTYQTSGLVSVMAESYVNLGGAHPSSNIRTWNFDLTTGEFLTFESIAENDANGEELVSSLTAAILNQIQTGGLSENYNSNYEEAVNNLAENANFYFDENGMTVTFDADVLAPYAVGAQSFTFSFDQFRDQLSDHLRSLLN